jgi:cytochrome P450
MPFTQAVIAETFRLSSVVPLGIQHRSTKNSEIESYFIPNDTVITTNLYHIHHDPEIWTDPFDFRPSRFLNQSGKFVDHEALLPFGAGYRRCVGEDVSSNAIFLYVTNIFQKFSVEFNTINGQDNGFEAQFSQIMSPKPFNVVFKEIYN